ncbi:ciliary microtubule associated protein 1A-like [Prinia subflava]|uniref:ciliary microtubule associated protein 1A-like n=1 Tax=Prinia subflava TaxID=208062 RepID=UPI002FE22C2B
MEGPWVGTWRPHPRRGPILAEFSTPGPKYWLPGTTGHTAHDPTRYRAPAYSFRGTKSLTEASCSPGPRYFIHASITKTGKHVAPSAHVTARPTTKMQVTPGPSDYTTEPADRHVYLTAPASSMKSRPKDPTGFRTPGPGTYTLPRVLGPHTVNTHAEPCYSMKWKSQYQSCFQDLAKTPGPAAFDNVEMDVYKRRAPKYSMGLRTQLAGTGTAPGPADYFPGKLSVTKARDPAFTFGLRHSLYKASLIPETLD